MPRRALRSYPTKYATDLTDEPWAALAPLVVTLSPKGGRPTDIDRRAIVNALLYKNRAGCQWRMLPKDVPPMSSVRYYFDKWNRDGTFIKMNDTLRKPARQALDPIRSRPSASWTPNPSKRPKQEENAATMGEKRSTGANGNSGLM